jgi:hypothetical protein
VCRHGATGVLGVGITSMMALQGGDVIRIHLPLFHCNLTTCPHPSSALHLDGRSAGLFNATWVKQLSRLDLFVLGGQGVVRVDPQQSVTVKVSSLHHVREHSQVMRPATSTTPKPSCQLISRYSSHLSSLSRSLSRSLARSLARSPARARSLSVGTGAGVAKRAKLDSASTRHNDIESRRRGQRLADQSFSRVQVSLTALDCLACTCSQFLTTPLVIFLCFFV